MKKSVMFLALPLVLAGCGRGVNDRNVIRDNGSLPDIIHYQTADTGIDSGGKDFEEKLTDGMYYVVHQDIYYPLASYVNNAGDEPKDYVEPDRQWYFNTENEAQIPTLFLGAGDRLVYYSANTLLDYITWERYYDLGYTIGIHDIEQMTNERAYIPLDDDLERIIPDSELYAIYELGGERVLLDKIGGVQITPDILQDGMITGTIRSRNYDLEVYNGTYYQHYTATANIRAFKAYELYASIGYKTLQNCFYEIEIPEYLYNGYYVLDNVGMFRLVREEAYSDETDFNMQLLFPEADKDHPEEYVAPRMYSDFEPLNKYVNAEAGTFGYIGKPDGTVEAQSDVNGAEKAQTLLKEATIKEFEIWMPAGVECRVTVKSEVGETTGDIYITTDKWEKPIPYNRIDGVYQCTFTGHDEKGILTISGLWNSYDIELFGCEQYAGQDMLSEDSVAFDTEGEDKSLTESVTEEE